MLKILKYVLPTLSILPDTAALYKTAMEPTPEPLPEKCSDGYYKLYVIRSLEKDTTVTQKKGEKQMSAIDRIVAPLQWQMKKEVIEKEKIDETCVDSTPIEVYFEKVPLSLDTKFGGFISVSDGETPVKGIAPMINDGGSVRPAGDGTFKYVEKIMEKPETELREKSLKKKLNAFLTLNLCSDRHCGDSNSWLNQDLAVRKGQLWGVLVKHRKAYPEGGVEALVQHRTFWATNHQHALHCYSICLTGPCKYPYGASNSGFTFPEIEWCGINTVEEAEKEEQKMVAWAKDATIGVGEHIPKELYKYGNKK